ncbi:MAG: hypothetical protein ACK4ND_00010 [Cytophagaceae bacterium]
MNRLLTYLFIFSILTFCSLKAEASHIRAGEITVERTSGNNLSFRITLTLYLKKSSQIDQSTARINLGDGTELTVGTFSAQDIGNDTEKRVYIANHTYQAAGYYIISFKEIYRNSGIINMSNSGGTELYLETYVGINPFIGINNTPVLLNPPLDKAVTGQKFIHNPVAFDVDGDSISYKLITPRKDAGVDVMAYRDPSNPEFGGGGAVTFSIDPITGDLIWQTPMTPGLYNIAFLVEEWRNGQRISYVVRDMQIEVVRNNNKPPVVNVPVDTCVVAGTFINRTISATDPDFHSMNLTSVSGVYNLIPNARANFAVNNPQPNPASGQFSWQTGCDHVRKEPYQIIFRAEDLPPAGMTRLVDTKPWSVRIFGPKLTGLVATPLNREIRLNWDAYSCPNANQIAIYRKDCSPTGGIDDICDEDALVKAGYKVIARVPAQSTTYLDNDNGEGLSKGTDYCYILVAEYPRPGRDQRSF